MHLCVHTFKRGSSCRSCSSCNEDSCTWHFMIILISAAPPKLSWNWKETLYPANSKCFPSNAVYPQATPPQASSSAGGFLAQNLHDFSHLTSDEILKIRLTSWYGKYPIIYRVLYNPRWCRISSIKCIGVKLYKSDLMEFDKRVWFVVICGCWIRIRRKDEPDKYGNPKPTWCLVQLKSMALASISKIKSGLHQPTL